MTMKRKNILVIFDDETRVVYSPQSSVRIANRGPSDTRIKDYEQVQTRPPLWFGRSEEHTSELQSLMRISYAVFCLKKKKKRHDINAKITEINKYEQSTAVKYTSSQ